jgi:hypothetical protein
LAVEGDLIQTQMAKLGAQAVVAVIVAQAALEHLVKVTLVAAHLVREHLIMAAAAVVALVRLVEQEHLQQAGMAALVHLLQLQAHQ